MKKLIVILIVSSLSLSLASGQLACGEPLKINDGWKFIKGDPKEASSPDYDDSRWQTLDLPHDWSVEGPYSPSLASATGYLPGGIAWYRKKIEIPARNKEMKFFLYFEGIYRNGEVFVNGTSLGMRPNGYISAFHDITALVRAGKTNTFAVRVDHSESADSRWYTGSGIYRDVWLVTASPIHIAPWGVYYTTHELNPRQTAVTIQTALNNSTPLAVTVTVVQELEDKDGTIVSKHSTKITLP